MENRCWGLVLTNGNVTRIEQTLRRIEALVSPKRCLVVVNDAQRQFLDPSMLRGAQVLAQPENRGTAAALIFGLLSVLARDPLATVLVTPADQGVSDPTAFLSVVRKGLNHVRSSEHIVLFGIEPSLAYTDHGWIAVAPGQAGGDAQRIWGFFERPDVTTARQLLRLGALVNTKIIAARAETLLRLCKEQLPELTAPLAEAATLPPLTREGHLRQRFATLPTQDFAWDVLTPAATSLRAYRIPREAEWLDLGAPDGEVVWAARPSARESVFAH